MGCRGRGLLAKAKKGGAEAPPIRVRLSRPKVRSFTALPETVTELERDTVFLAEVTERIAELARQSHVF